MDNIPAADDQDSFSPQRQQFTAQIIVEPGRPGKVNAELKNRYIGRREKMFENGPGAVIQPSCGTDSDLHRMDDFRGLARQRRGAGCIIRNFKDIRMKRAEIIDRAGMFGGGHDDPVPGEPMGGDHQDGPGSGKIGGGPTQGGGEGVVLERIDRMTMANKKYRHHFFHLDVQAEDQILIFDSNGSGVRSCLLALR